MIVVAAIVTFTFSEAYHTHLLLLLSNIVVLAFRATGDYRIPDMKSKGSFRQPRRTGTLNILT